MVNDISDRYKRRDYTKELISTSHQEIPAEEPKNYKNTKKPRKKLKPSLANIARVIVLALIIGAGFLAWKHFTQSSPMIPKDIRQSVNYPLYYPNKLPKDYIVNVTSFDNTGQAITFTVRYLNKANILFAEQPIPTNLNLDNFQNKQIMNAKAIKTKLGTAYFGTYNNNTAISLVSGQTWIFISSAVKIPDDDVSYIVNNLAEVK